MWRFEGNKLQFEFNSEVVDNFKQVILTIEMEKESTLLNGSLSQMINSV